MKFNWLCDCQGWRNRGRGIMRARQQAVIHAIMAIENTEDNSERELAPASCTLCDQ